MAGYKIYSNVKLVCVASEKKSRSGYSIQFNWTTASPSSHVVICLNINITLASRILFLGTKIIRRKIIIINADISIMFAAFTLNLPNKSISLIDFPYFLYTINIYTLQNTPYNGLFRLIITLLNLQGRELGFPYSTMSRLRYNLILHLP